MNTFKLMGRLCLTFFVGLSTLGIFNYIILVVVNNIAQHTPPGIEQHALKAKDGGIVILAAILSFVIAWQLNKITASTSRNIIRVLLIAIGLICWLAANSIHRY